MNNKIQILSVNIEIIKIEKTPWFHGEIKLRDYNGLCWVTFMGRTLKELYQAQEDSLNDYFEFSSSNILEQR